MIEEIVEKLLKAKKVYYEGNPILTDTDFDLLEEQLRNIDPTNNYFNIVGAPVNTQGNDIVHKHRMKSMDKGKKPEDCIKWMNKINLKEGRDIFILPKVDGVSATLKYNKGKLVYVATRGDGTVGKDITHIAKHVKDIPEDIALTEDEIEIRGELYLPKWTKYDTKNKPLRNNCTGLINRQSDHTQTHHLRFVAYQIVGSNHTLFEEVLESLECEGFNTASYTWTDSIEKIYKDYLTVLRDKWEYETDGLVLVVNDLTSYKRINSLYKDNDHHWFTNFALKPPSEGKQTTLQQIDWQMSRQGLLIPVAIFKPIIIGGASIQRATANNYENVKNMELKRGDAIFIERANDVIPFLKTNNGGGHGNLIPIVCPHCGSKLEEQGVHLACTNYNCEEQVVQRLIYYVREAGIDGVAEGMIRTIYETGLIKTPADLYRIIYEDLRHVEGLGDSKITTFIEGLEKDRVIQPTQLLSRLNIPLVRKKGLVKLGIKTIEQFLNYTDKSTAIGKNVVEWKEKQYNIDLLNDLVRTVEIKHSTANKKETKGKICATGKCTLGRKELIKVIEEKGYEWSSSVSKELKILLVDDINGSSSKLVKARKNGVEIMLYEEFLR